AITAIQRLSVQLQLTSHCHSVTAAERSRKHCSGDTKASYRQGLRSFFLPPGQAMRYHRSLLHRGRPLPHYSEVIQGAVVSPRQGASQPFWRIVMTKAELAR